MHSGIHNCLYKDHTSVLLHSSSVNYVLTSILYSDKKHFSRHFTGIHTSSIFSESYPNKHRRIFFSHSNSSFFSFHSCRPGFIRLIWYTKYYFHEKRNIFCFYHIKFKTKRRNIQIQGCPIVHVVYLSKIFTLFTSH